MLATADGCLMRPSCRDQRDLPVAVLGPVGLLRTPGTRDGRRWVVNGSLQGVPAALEWRAVRLQVEWEEGDGSAA